MSHLSDTVSLLSLFALLNLLTKTKSRKVRNHSSVCLSFKISYLIAAKLLLQVELE